MKQLEADVVVVSAGTAGLAATVAAAQGGAKVITFEKASVTGGAGNMAGGPLGVGSRLQRVKKIPLTHDEAFRLFMDHTRWTVDARLVRAFIDKSGSTIDWLEEIGVEFYDISCHNYGYHYTWHLIKSPEAHGAGAVMMKILTDKARELGAAIYLKTPVKKILKKDDHIAGVVAEDELGEAIQVNAGCVIVATGGCGDNPEMVKKYTGYDHQRNISLTRIPGVVGDGIRMAWEAGAAATDIHVQLGMGPQDLMDLEEVVLAFKQPNLLVNSSGGRIMNEEIIETTAFGANAVARQKDQYAFMIFDEAIKQGYQAYGVDFPPMYPAPAPVWHLNSFDAEFQQALDRGSSSIFAANTLEELAAKTGLPPEELKNTVAEYNHASDSGRDVIFNKDAKFLRPLRQPKYYAAKLTLGGMETFGGIRINYKTEVLDKEERVILGLYAAGNDANSIYGDTYPFFLPGNTLGFALNTGRIAGENAANHLKKSTGNQD